MSKLKCALLFITVAGLPAAGVAQDRSVETDDIDGNLISCWSEGKLVINDTLDSVQSPSILSSVEGINIKGLSASHQNYYFSMNENTVCRLRIEKDTQEVSDENTN